ISGTVTVAGSPAPSAGATVIASGPTYMQVTTAADGTYTISGLSAGSHHVSAQADGFGTSYYNAKPFDGQADQVVVGNGATTSGINFALAGHAGTISGRLTDTTGTIGIASAHVNVNVCGGGYVMGL